MSQPIHGPAAEAAIAAATKEPWNNADMLRWKMKWTRETLKSEIPMIEARLRLWRSYRDGMPDPVAKELVSQVIWDMEQVLLAFVSLQEYANAKA